VTVYVVNAMNKYQQSTLPDVMFTLKSAILHTCLGQPPSSRTLLFF